MIQVQEQISLPSFVILKNGLLQFIYIIIFILTCVYITIELIHLVSEDLIKMTSEMMMMRKERIHTMATLHSNCRERERERANLIL